MVSELLGEPRFTMSAALSDSLPTGTRSIGSKGSLWPIGAMEVESPLGRDHPTSVSRLGSQTTSFLSSDLPSRANTDGPDNFGVYQANGKIIRAPDAPASANLSMSYPFGYMYWS